MTTETRTGTEAVKAATRHWEFVDVLNVLACLAVILLHVSLNAFTPEPSHAWVKAVAFQAVGIFAVPVYFMISGMNLLGYRRRYSTRVFFKKRLWRVGKALVLASLVCYLLFGLFPAAFGTQAVADSFGPVDFVRRFLTDDVNSFYWFLYSIIYLYMITPLLSLAADDKRLMRYLIVVDFAIAWGVPLLERLGVAEQYFTSSLHWPLYMSQDMLYFLLGYYLVHHVEWRIPAWVWLLVAAASAAVMFGTALWINGYFSGALSGEYHNYGINGSPVRVVESVAVFMLFRGLEPRLRALPARVRGLIRTLSGAVLGVYLFHLPVVNWLTNNVHGAPGEMLARFPLLRLVVIYVVTAAIVIAVKQGIRIARRAIR
ncbi:acyltransferase [Bifidobacterium parmae]|uniref:Acyltransferase n=1 Tax=Bifidobacterium parmae TaxID=361854 RepID=A0A2N5J3L1_9BIFI|nr:acyltransferase [Bifidobacterium parmae]PLS28812.1 acyltransferase [Bifidobacterium parmae]